MFGYMKGCNELFPPTTALAPGLQLLTRRATVRVDLPFKGRRPKTSTFQNLDHKSTLQVSLILTLVFCMVSFSNSPYIKALFLVLEE